MEILSSVPEILDGTDTHMCTHTHAHTHANTHTYIHKLGFYKIYNRLLLQGCFFFNPTRQVMQKHSTMQSRNIEIRLFFFVTSITNTSYIDNLVV